VRHTAVQFLIDIKAVKNEETRIAGDGLFDVGIECPRVDRNGLRSGFVAAQKIAPRAFTPSSSSRNEGTITAIFVGHKEICD